VYTWPDFIKVETAHANWPHCPSARVTDFIFGLRNIVGSVYFSILASPHLIAGPTLLSQELLMRNEFMDAVQAIAKTT
jgi:hypothetical protein